MNFSSITFSMNLNFVVPYIFFVSIHLHEFDMISFYLRFHFIILENHIEWEVYATSCHSLLMFDMKILCDHILETSWLLKCVGCMWKSVRECTKELPSTKKKMKRAYFSWFSFHSWIYLTRTIAVKVDVHTEV